MSTEKLHDTLVKGQDILFYGGITASTAKEINDVISITVINEYLYTAVLLVTLTIGVIKLFRKKK